MSDKKSGIFDSLLSFSFGKFNNSFLSECYKTVYNSEDITHDDLLHFLQSKGFCENVSKDALRSKLERNRLKFNKLRGAKKEEFLQQAFQFPVAKPNIHATNPLPIQVHETPSTSHSEESRITELKKEKKELKVERKGTKRKIERKQRSLSASKEKIRKLSEENVTLQRKLKTSEKMVGRQNKAIMSLNAINRTHKATIKTYKDQQMVHEKRAEIEQAKSEYFKEKHSQAEIKLQESEREKQNSIDSINKLKSENKDLLESIEYCETLLNDECEFSLYDEKGHLTNQAEICIMNLLSAKVGINHVGNVIKAVFEMSGKEISRVPDEKTVRNINDRMLALSLKQLSEEFTQKEETTLYTDETTKLGTKISGYHASDKEGNFWVLGLRELSNKSSQMTLEVFKQILDDVDLAAKKINPSKGLDKHAGHKILSKIKNTMSDRAATEVAFNELLQDYRNQVLPDIVDKWEEFDANEKDIMSRMNNFFCGLHLLVGFAETAEKVICKYEQANYKQPLGAAADPATKHFTKSSESGVARTVRTTAKALARGADEKSGCYRSFKNFLDEANKKERLEKYLGNRFNILFHDAEILFYLHEDIENFISNVYGATNLLLQGVLADVREEKYIAGCKCLGLCSKLFTAPFWRLIESDGHILDMNDHYLNMQGFLQEASRDPTDFMTGTNIPFDNLVVKDHIYERLIIPDEKLDPTVQSMLMVIFTAWHSYLKKSVGDHLPGGKHSLPSDRVKEECKSASKHNKFPERVFGLMDSLVRHRPNASEMCNEAFIMFTNNKTSSWLESKSDTEKAALLKDAHQLGSSLRKQFRMRTKEIARQRMEGLRKRQQLKEQKSAKKIREKEKLTDKIIYYGLWQSKETVERKMKEIKTKAEKEKALKKQLKFRQEVLQQTSRDMGLFKYSKQKQKLEIKDLQNNLETLITEAFELQDTQEQSPDSHDKGPLLKGRNVNHWFETDNVRTSYKGYVISAVPGFSNFYNIIYEGDDNVYTYKLLEDYANGDLVILVD